MTPDKHGCLSLPGPGALRLFGMAESACDIPLKTRLQWLVELERICPTLAKRTTLIKRRLKRCSDKAKYDLFYDPSPLVAFYREGLLSVPLGCLRDKLIMALRVHTLGRSSDLSHVLPNLWVHQGSYNCRFLDKTGRQRLLTLSGRPLQLFVVYLARVSGVPAPFLLRYHNDLHRCLGAEAVAKVVLKLMTDCGIDTNLFKAHSVRGASATALLAAGVDQTLTRQRGGWTDSRAFDVHYARLHQLIAWDACLQDGLPPCTPQLLPRCTGGSSSSPGVADKGCLREPTAQEANSLSASAARAKSSVPEPTKEGEGKEDEHRAAEALRLLNVRQLVCPLGGGPGLPGMFWRYVHRSGVSLLYLPKAGPCPLFAVPPWQTTSQGTPHILLCLHPLPTFAILSYSTCGFDLSSSLRPCGLSGCSPWGPLHSTTVLLFSVTYHALPLRVRPLGEVLRAPITQTATSRESPYWRTALVLLQPCARLPSLHLPLSVPLL